VQARLELKDDANASDAFGATSDSNFQWPTMTHDDVGGDDDDDTAAARMMMMMISAPLVGRERALVRP
jgi:hypothetical protein